MRLIDADALIGTLHNYGFYDGNDRTLVYEVIQLQPTIEPERLKGHWIPIDEDSDVYECDVCRTTYDTICGTFDLPYFCPHCGADMRGDQNG